MVRAGRRAEAGRRSRRQQLGKKSRGPLGCAAAITLPSFRAGYAWAAFFFLAAFGLGLMSPAFFRNVRTVSLGWAPTLSQ